LQDVRTAVARSRDEPKILILSVESGLRDSLASLLASSGPVVCASGSVDALARLDQCRTLRLLVLSEISDDFTTLDLLEEARRRPTPCGDLGKLALCVVLLTSN
jgi:CheY-like chemotaxis protein